MNILKNKWGFKILILLIFQSPVFAQNTPNLKSKQTDKIAIEGIRIGLDLTSPLASLIEAGTLKYGAVIGFDLNNKLYFTLDYGQHEGIRESVLIDQLFKYTTIGDYFIFGLDYNFEHNKIDGGAVFLGLRYGLSNFKNSLSYTIQEDYWQINSKNYTIESDMTQATWLALVGGVKAKLIGNIYIGITARLRFLNDLPLTNPVSTEFPGFGYITSNTRFSMTQYIFYRFPTRKNN